MRRFNCQFIMILGLAVVAGSGCTNAFFRQPILDLIGPTTAVADAGNNQSAASGQGVVLNGSGSYLLFGSGRTQDAITSNFTFLWKVTTVPNGAVAPTLNNAATSQATFTGTTAGTYVVTLTVSNGTQTGTDTVTIVVQ